MTTVGELWRFPVKSMAGERVEETELRWAGLAGDRRYAFVRSENPSRFPWLTAKVHARLLQYAVRCVDPSDPNQSAIEVTPPQSAPRRVSDPSLVDALAQEYGEPVHLLHSGRGLHDAAQVSVIARASVDALCRAHGLEPDPRRFRMNVMLDGVGAFEEETWLGRTLRFGDGANAARIRLDRRTERCAMVNRDPRFGADSDLLTRLAKERDACAGLYASVVAPGRIRVGDAVYFD